MLGASWRAALLGFSSLFCGRETDSGLERCASGPRGVRHGGGGHDPGGLRGDAWLQEAVRSVPEQEVCVQITGFHTTQTYVVKRGRKANRTRVEADTQNPLQTSTCGKRLHRGGWDRGTRRGVSVPCRGFHGRDSGYQGTEDRSVPTSSRRTSGQVKPGQAWPGDLC